MENNYQNYQSMVTTVTTGITQMDEVCRHLSMDAQADELSGIGQRLKEHVFSVGIMGEFKRGKSTVINALLGSKIIPADIMPCSATLNYIRWDASKYAEVKFKDGSTKNVSVEELSDYITKLTEESERQAENVDSATVYYPCPFCQNGVQIIDTPGLNDDDRMNAISESVIPTLDAIIMVLVPGSPFSISEAEFVRNKIMTSDLGRIIFVVNKIDMVDEDEQDRILSHIKSKIKSSVLEKMKAVYGEDSEEYKNAADKLSGIRVIGVSAKQALKAKQNNDARLLEESGFNEFESMLSTLLTEERGMLELIHPVNQIISTAKGSLETIETRVEALNMDAQEFKKVQKESIEKIKDTRKRKKEEIKTLKAKGKTLYADLLPEVDVAYDEVCNNVLDYVYNVPISDEDIKDQASMDAFSQQVSDELQGEIEGAFSIATEGLINEIDNQLGEDVAALESFGADFAETVNDIQINLRTPSVSTDANFGSNAKSVLLDVGAMVGAGWLFGTALPGVGALISGYREHGVKGAVVGGLSGAGIGVAAAGIAAGIFGASIIGWPLLLIVGAASTFGGRAVTNLIFGKKKQQQSAAVSADAVRDKLLESTENAVAQMRDDKVLEKWLKDYCKNAYESVADNIDGEWENTLITLEGSLSEIEADIKMNETNKNNLVNTMNGYVEVINSVLQEVQPIHEKLTAALNQN